MELIALTKNQVLEMIDRAKAVYVGVRGIEGICYFHITHDAARRKAAELVDCGLRAEFGAIEDGLSDVLYLEGSR